MTPQQAAVKAMATLAQRGKDYDKPSGERSMAAAVAAFNAIVGSGLKESDGWLFMLLLKQSRQYQSLKFHEDSAIDAIAYAALHAESLSENR